MTLPSDTQDILMILSHPEEDHSGPHKHTSDTGRDLRLE